MSKKKKSTTDKLKGIVVKPEDKRAHTEKKVLQLLSELGIKVIKDKDDLNNWIGNCFHNLLICVIQLL